MLDWLGSYSFAALVTLIYGIAGLGMHIMLRAGLFAVPQIGLMAIGAYTSAIVTLETTQSFVVALGAGALAAALVGGLLGGLLHRLDGIQLALATIAFSEIVRVMARNMGITGGADGLVGISLSTEDWHVIVTAAVAVAALYAVNRTRYSIGIDAMRQDTLVAAHAGVSLGAYRAALFALSGLFAGLSGAMLAHVQGFLQPDQFSLSSLLLILAAVILGGMLSPIGVFIGATLVFGVPVLWTGVVEVQQLVFGVVVVVLMMVEPLGIAGMLSRAWRRVARERRVSPLPAQPRTEEPSPGSAEPGESLPSPKRTHEQRAAPVPGASAPPPVLKVAGLTMAFGGVRAVDDVSLELGRGELLGLIGPNGSGKTTLLNVLSGILPPMGGSVICGGSALPLARPEAIAGRGLSRTFQGIRLLDEWSVMRNVEVGGYLPPGRNASGAPRDSSEPRLGRAGRSARAAALLRRLGVEEEIFERPISSLPYGVQRRVEIARALMSDPRVLLLDEPTAGMTAGESREIFELARSLCSTGTSVIVVEHDVAMITEFSDRVAVLNFGKLIALGLPDEVIAQDEVAEAYLGRA